VQQALVKYTFANHAGGAGNDGIHFCCHIRRIVLIIKGTAIT
jgi:hypothetical protein